MPFRTELYVRAAAGRNRWALVRPLIYVTHAEEMIIVPSGFITDLASIPWLARTIVPHQRAERMPAVVHDFLFVIQDRTLPEVDRIIKEAMQDTGVGWYARTMINTGLAIGSWAPWRKNASALREDRAAFLRSYGLVPSQYPHAGVGSGSDPEPDPWDYGP